jgi:hypothetical protein
MFSFVAMLIGHNYWLQELRQEAIAADPSLRGKFDGVNNAMYNASVLQTTIAAAGLIINGKEIAKGVAEAAKDVGLQKIAESIKEHK